MSHVYVASSWRNPRYESVLDCLDQWALPYYNWRDEEGFHWSEVMREVDPERVRTGVVEHWIEPIPPAVFASAMHHERAQAGFNRDMTHLINASCVILLLPCGKSAHLEAGWAVGAGRPVALYTAQQSLQPELMYGMMDLITDDIDELMRWTYGHHKMLTFTNEVAPRDRDLEERIDWEIRNRSQS